MKKQVMPLLAATALLAATGHAQVYSPGPQTHPWQGNGPMMGPGMMGPGQMGPGMMGGIGRLRDLGPEQRSRISDIQREYRARQWSLMQQMHELMWNAPGDDEFDEQAQRRTYDQMAALRKQMFENALDMRKRVDAILTPQQREELRRGWRGGR